MKSGQTSKRPSWRVARTTQCFFRAIVPTNGRISTCLRQYRLFGDLYDFDVTVVSIDDASADVLRAFGDGDLSLGIRRAAAHIKIS